MRSIFWKHRRKYVSAVVVCLCVTVVVYLHLPDGIPQISERKHSGRITNRHAGNLMHQQASYKNLTVFIREFEEFENRLFETVATIERSIGGVPIAIVADTLPYPPVNLSQSRSAHVLTLASHLSKTARGSCPLQSLNTEYALFIPDGLNIHSWAEIEEASSFLVANRQVKAVAIATVNTNASLECSVMKVNLKEWTVSLHGDGNNTNGAYCSYVEGLHALLTTKETLLSLSEPFAQPFPYSFYVQASVKNWNVYFLKNSKFTMFHKFFKDFHSRWKHKHAQSERLLAFYKKVGIKREILKSGVSNYYGCTKTTDRCFGTVVNDMPRYLYEGRWTPPCCLRALRETVAHVFAILDKCKTRYWLEGGSLLGAARHGDLIPWDYDVDVGIYRADLDKCHHLQQAELSPYVDDEDYVWEKAREGEFYRVQYSETNHLHVDIFPFYSKNGTMTKNTWFATHRQDTEFPESFLLPLTKITFAGVEASAPNNVRKFLEFKFGKNVIENPKYPNLESPWV